MSEDKTKESRGRRAASRVGWRMENSRARRTHLNDQGLYQMLNGNIVIGGDRYDATLDQCASWIEEERVRQAA